MREEFGLKPYDKVIFVQRGGALVLKPVKDILSIRGSVKVDQVQDFNKIREIARKENAKRIADE
jgi:bifunctional DNA-binding transcriptional regulator/antitoxin component of YhaV-PrlF toxin-antitoxin module